MREDDRLDPRLVASKDELAEKIAAYCVGRRLDKQTIHDVEEIYRDHFARARLDGIDFPELVPVVMDVVGRIRLVRRDLEVDGINNLIVELAQSQGDRYDPSEVARAIRRAFPHHRTPDPRH